MGDIEIIKELLLVKVQFMYMSRPNLKVKEHFLDALIQNIKDLKLSDDLENSLLALAIKAFGSKLRERELLCDRALDIIEALWTTSSA
jgi:hypothetical protein